MQVYEQAKDWSEPKQCSSCRYPVADSNDACPSCGRPTRLFSTHSGRLAWKGLRRLAGRTFEAAQLLCLVSLLLLFGYYLSPLLLLFPLVALCAPPPASRGGRTVRHGRKRAKI